MKRILRFVRRLLNRLSRTPSEPEPDATDADDDPPAEEPPPGPETPTVPDTPATPENGHEHDHGDDPTDGKDDEQADKPAEGAPPEADKDEDLNRSQDEDLGINWPPTKHVTAPHEGEGDETIEVSLYHRAGDDYAHQAARQTAPFINYAFEEAWGTDYTVDVRVIDEPAPASLDSRDDFHDWFWHDAPPETRSTEANCLIVNDEGIHGSGGGHIAIIDAAPNFEGWGYDPDDPPVLYGHGDNHYGVNIIMHEVGHCMGLSHDGDPIQKYGRRMVSPMRTSYDEAAWFLHELHKECRTQTPQVKDEL